MSADPGLAANPPVPPPRRRRRWPWIVLGMLALVVLLVAGTLAWLLKTSQGARFALDRAAGASGGTVTFQGVEGSIDETLRIARIEVSRPELYVLVQDAELRASPWPPLRGLIHVERLAARTVEVRSLETGEAAKAPESLRAPSAVRLDEARVGELRLGALSREAAAETDPARRRALVEPTRKDDTVVRDILVRGDGGLRQWRIHEARAATDYGTATVAGTVGAAPPFALDLRAALAGSVAGRPYRANVAAKGTLEAIQAAVDGDVSGQQATVRAEVTPFGTVPIRSLEARAAGVDLARHAEGLPRTRLDVDVALTAQGKAFAGPVRLRNAAPAPWDAGGVPFSDARARVVVGAEQLDVADLQVALSGGGRASGRATLRRSGSRADLALADVDLSALHRELQPTKVGGRFAVAGDQKAQRFEVALKDPRFEVDGRAQLAGGRFTIDAADVRTGGGAVHGAGFLALEGRKEFRFEGRAAHFDPSAFARTEKGDLNFTFVAHGALEPAIAGEAKVTLAPSRFAGLPASGRIDVAGDKERVARADVALAIGDARVAARGSFGRKGDALEVSLDAPNVSTLAKPFAVAASGKLGARARLTGTFGAPAGQVTVEGANLTLPSNVFLRDVRLRGEAGAEPDSPIEVTLAAKGVALGGEGPPRPFAEAIDATLKGTRAAHRLEAAARMTRASTLRVALEGGLDAAAKDPAWEGRVETLAMEGRNAFGITAPAPLFASAARVELGATQFKGEWGEARVDIVRWTPDSLAFRGSSPGVEVRTLARQLQLDEVPRSNLVLAFDWDVRGAETFDAKVNLRRVSGDVRVGEPLTALGLRTIDLRAESVGGRARATLVIDGERSGRVTGEATATIARGESGWELAPDAPVKARLVAEHTNLEALSPWLGVDARLGGRFHADLTVDGTGANPRVSGTARAEDLALREPLSGFEMEQGDLQVRLAGETLALERFSVVTPWRPPAAARERFRRVEIPEAGGRITADGSLDLRGRSGTLRVKLDRAVLTQTHRRFVAASGEARLAGGGKGFDVTGAFQVDAGWVGALETAPPTPSEDVVVVRTATPPQPSTEAGADPLRLDVRLRLGDRMSFEGRGLDTRLAGEIHVTGTPAALKAVGTIRTEGGTYNGYGQKLTIERGVLRFNGPIDNPQLSVLALRKGLAVEAGVEVLGSVTRPRVRLVSVPDVPEPEKLSWLVLGRGPSELAPGDASVLLAAATSMLGGNNPGSDLGQRLGLDEVRIGRADSGSILGVLPQSTVAGKTGSPSAADVVSVGKKIRRDVHLTYEQGLGDAEGTLKVAWQITRRFQMLVRAGFLPGLDAVYRWRLD